MTIVPAVLIYVVMRGYKLGYMVSVAVAWLFLISLANLSVWPKPAHFALIIILLFLYFARSAQDYTQAAPILAVGALVSSFVRPEYMLTYLLFTAGYIIVLLKGRNRQQIKAQIIPALTLLAASVGLMAVFGVPGLDNQGSRSFEAFAQHFSINWVGWTGSTLNPWTDYPQIMALNFGDAHSLLGAAQHNPAVVLRHIATNIVNYAATIVQLPFVHFNVLLPGNTRAMTLAEGVLLMAAVLGVAIARRSELRMALRAGITKQRRFLWICACFVLPSVASAIVIYPENHYLIAQIVLGAIALGVIVAKPAEEPQPLPRHHALALIAVLLIATPYISTNWYFTEQSASEGRRLNNLHTIQYLRSLQFTQPLNMLEADGGYYIYVGDNVHRVAQSTKDTDFTTFMRQKKLDMIVVSSDLANDSRFKDDQSWLAFLSDFRSFGFEAVDIPGTDRKLIARQSILASVAH
jgi:hypothetical protein